jgi:hypothetical protein
VVAVERYPIDTEGMIRPAKRIKAAMRDAEAAGEPIDALFVPGGESTLPMIAATLPYVGIDARRVKLLGTSGWDYPGATGERALAGGWFAAPDPASWHAFARAFAKSTGNPPPRLASLAYDAVMLSAQLAGGSSGGHYAAPALTRTSGFNGVDGNYRFLPDGTSERSLAILELHSSGPRVVQAAPHGFDLPPVALGPRPRKPAPAVATAPPPAPTPVVDRDRPQPVPPPSDSSVIIIND